MSHPHDLNTQAANLAHSEEHFGEHRDYWWNNDFLDLMAQRWRLGQYTTLLDVGCGQCHWGRLLAPRMCGPVKVTAYDRDPKWAAGSDAIRAAFATVGAEVEFRHGDACRLPFDDDSFDVVTCQTVLMHVDDPLAALREMRRVTRPGGIVICSEPCNLAQMGLTNALNAEETLEERCEAFRYALLCELGKRAAGEGSLSLGDRLPLLFQQAGFIASQTYLGDKAIVCLPPYGNDEAQASLNDLIEAHEHARVELWHSQVNSWIGALSDPAATEFVGRYHAKADERRNKLQTCISEGRYWDSGAGVNYVVSAYK
jgi:SAM-dependent methyltransferase